VTYGAGLVGALLVGVSAAKALAYSLGVPLYAVNHIEAHIAANYISTPQLKPPFLAVVASGGHTGVARVDGRNELTMRVWERGSGETWACGTGACAVAVASVLNGYADKNAPITVHLRGGDLIITYTDETVFMEGTATLAFTGEVEI